MRKTEKLLRRLLADYRERLVKMPYSSERSMLVDCVTFIIEAINEQNRNLK